MAEQPEPAVAREWLETMTLIRRFEERAGEMYARAKVGGFLHLSIGEEATIVGSARALRDSDYLISTYRSHGHALVRGTPPENVMAELFGRADGCSGGRGGSMHMFDISRRFMGGYGIVGGNLPIAAGLALASDYDGSEDVTLCTFGDGASNQGTFGETLNLAALWRLPVVFMVTNNQFGMGTSLQRHSAVTDLQRKGESLGVPGMRCDGMDVQDTYRVVCEAIARVREQRRPLLIEAVTYRFRGHSMADPEQYRSKEEVAQWRQRDPIPAFGAKLVADGVLDDSALAEIDAEAIARVDGAVAFAEASPYPPPESLYDDVYVLDSTSTGSYSVRTTQPQDGAAAGANDERPEDNGEIPQQISEALAREEHS
ncbi:MAG TPA: pyruvate dehydrogenase (acetyl-transferring) E1 component subunit alpha [Solirubrobacteraceae bacterium]|jgi:pyruvate dehydrogenase E1 component alpha subunit|nr:pyruvate dehydrogenase (acetyl-transferring) E1 component subunit alpha [Solirubrobacteraceae bacterium]